MFINSDFYKDPQVISFMLFAFFTLIQLFYHWYYYARAAFYKIKPYNIEGKAPAISVIICAKNEFQNLEKFLPVVLEQDYPNFEVILVNDFSQDDSYFLLKAFEEKYSHFKVIHLRENVNFFEGKKLALAVGIKSAKNDIILLTDADCKPTGKNWMKSMSAQFSDQTEIVLGYGGYTVQPGFLNKLIRFDTLSIAMQYMGMALAGNPYMGVGRNLAYKKELFFKSGGFTSHYKVKSGDDDLFINQSSNGRNTAINLHPDGMTFSEPKKNFSSWFSQKKRHLSTGKYYKTSDKLRLGIQVISNSMFYILFIASLVLIQSPLFLILVLGTFVIRTISLVLLHYNAGKRFMERKLFLYSPIFDLIFQFLNPVFALSNLFYRKNKWK
jgi:poly-beta-1,6-N-acetyl-D-glucosamine synthase